MIYIGITGFKKKEDATTILKYCKSTEKYMFGYLVSEKSLRFEDMGEFRYPTFKSYEEFKNLLDFKTDGNIIKMIHFNSSKTDFHERLIPFLKFVKPDALQLNLNFISKKSINELRKECPDIDLLFVYNKSIENKYTKEEIQEILKDFKYMLFDFSGGNGLKISPEVVKKADYFQGILKGYAGGLSGDNVQEFIKMNKGEYFIDAENRLLKNESLNYDECKKYIESASNI